MSRSTFPTAVRPIYHENLGRPVLSQDEAKCHRCIEILSQGRCRILVKTRLIDFLSTKSIAGAQDLTQARVQYVDFLLCRHEDWLPMVGIELFDATVESEFLSSRNPLVSSYLKQICLPLVRIEVKELDLAEKFRNKLVEAWSRRERHLLVSGAAIIEKPLPSTARQRQQRNPMNFVTKSTEPTPAEIGLNEQAPLPELEMATASGI